MDRNVLTGTILITLILMVWMFYLTPPPPPADLAASDSLATESVEPAPEPVAPVIQAPVVSDTMLAGAYEGEEQFITVDNNLYEARFSTKGGSPVSFQLKNYKNFDQVTPVQLVDTLSGGALSLAFTTPGSHNIDTRNFYFTTDHVGDRLAAGAASGPSELAFETQVGEGTLRLVYTFNPDSYEVGLRVEQENAGTFSTREGYELVWNGGVPFSEDNPTQETIKSGAYARSGGEVEGITLVSEVEERKTLRGQVDWAAVKNQYFTAVMMTNGETRGAELDGERFGETDDPNVKEVYEARLLMPQNTGTPDNFTLYLGPMEYYRISSYDLGIYDMVDYGWDFFEWITRPIAKFVFIPIFALLGNFIPSYGIIIIVLAFLIKMVVYPLTKKSYRSMAQMRELQPQLNALKEKYTDNPQKQQEATMKLYKESGVNPLGGCLPMFFQYPIIIALWQFLPQSIAIRQQGFLWANDLSAPDVIFNLPFTIPFYGDFVAGFCLLMGLSMVAQMKLQATPAAGPQAKMMMYLMPVMLFVIFNTFAAGLNLYYLCYNVLSAIQQRFINKSIEKEKEDGDTTSNGRPAKSSKAKSKPGRQQRRTGAKNAKNVRSRNGRARSTSRKR